jgi:hypothetical protein
MTLPAIGSVSRQGLLLVTTVDRLAQPEALIASAIGKTEAADERAFEEVRYRQIEGLFLGVETRRHGRSIAACYWRIPAWQEDLL